MEPNFIPLTKEQERLRAAERGMAYRGDEPLADWQQKAREKLTQLLGLPYERCDPRFQVEYRDETEDFYETRFTFQCEEGCFAPAHFLTPKKKTCEKPPVMICLQGHSTGMHISLGRTKYPEDDKAFDGERYFALEAVRRGFCAVTLEQRGFGERGGTPRPDCYPVAMTALLTGRTLLGGRVWDIMRLIDVLEQQFADVCDVGSVWCCGNSGGGTATFYATALEPRIVAAIPSCAFCTFADSIGAMYHCSCNYVPGIRKCFDMAELAGMIAPRPLVIVSGAQDEIFPLFGAQAEFALAKEQYYARSEHPENIAHVIGDGGHRFYAAPAWERFLQLTEAKKQ